MAMAAKRISDLTVDELWGLLRDRVQKLIRAEVDEALSNTELPQTDLSDFPVDHYGSWPADLSLRREDM